MPSVPNRLGRKQGRFSVDFEINEINAGLRGQQQAFGDEVDYWRFESERSTVNDIYDEGAGGGKVFNGPIRLPVLSAVHLEGTNQNLDTGFYANDELHVTLTFDAFSRTGMVASDLRPGDYLRDRITYDNVVFRVTKVEILGQIQRRDIIVTIEATQVKGDELVDDPQFAHWSD